MKRNKFSESQIVKAIKEHESGKSASDICRVDIAEQADPQRRPTNLISQVRVRIV